MSGLYDIVFCTESWLNETVSDGILCASTDYNVFRCDRLVKIGGGVAIFSKKNHNLCKIEIDSHLEVLICDLITSCKQKTRFMLCYRPPKYDFDYAENFCSTITDFLNISRCVLLGDFNLPFIFKMVKLWIP